MFQKQIESSLCYSFAWSAVVKSGIKKYNSACINIGIWKIIPYLQANPYRLKTKNINSLIFISKIINKLMLMGLFLFLGLVFFLKKEKSLSYIDADVFKMVLWWYD